MSIKDNIDASKNNGQNINQIDEKSKKSLYAAIWYIVTNFISKAILYLCTPIYIRLLTQAEYGEYGNFLSWQNILISLLTFELASSVTVAYYDYKNSKDFYCFVNTISVFSYLIPCFFCSFIVIFHSFFSKLLSIQSKYLIILAAYIVLNNTMSIFQTEQRVALKYKVSSILTISTSLATLFLSVSFALLFSDRLLGILLGGVVVNSIVSFVLAIIIGAKGKRINLNHLKYAIAISLPLVPHVLATTVLGSSDKVMITRYCGNEMNALYSLAYTISMIITMIASSINKAWVPWFFDRLISNTRAHIKRVSNTIVACIASICVMVCLLAPEVILIIGRKSYVAGAVVMPPVIVACLINCVSTFYINIEF